MIKLKNRSEEYLQSGKAGNAATGAYATFVMGYSGQIKALLARVRTAGVTGTMHVDIQKNGTSIFSGATKVDFASGSTTPTYGALSSDPTTFVKGDIITVNITAVHTTPAVDTALVIVVQRSKQSQDAATETDTVGKDAE